MKNLLFNFLFFLLFFICGCSKQNIKSKKNLAKNYYQQSLLETEEKNYQKALQLINKSIEISPTCQSLALQATLFYQIKEFSKSLEIFKKIIKDKNSSPSIKADAMNNLACNYLALGQLEDAKQLWAQLTSNSDYLSPEVAWFNLGLLEFNNAMQNYKSNKELFKYKIKQSQKFFSKALAIASQYLDAYFYLAFTYMHLEEFKKAQEVMKAVLSIAPEHNEARELLNYLEKQNIN